MALKVELLEKKPTHSGYRRGPTDSSLPTSDKGKPVQSSDPKNQSKGAADGRGNQATSSISKDMPKNPNPYAKPMGDKCYRCGKPRHRSNGCPDRPSVNLVEEGNEEGAEDDFEYEDDPSDDAELAVEDGERVNCVVQRILFAPKSDDQSQRHNIFQSSCYCQLNPIHLNTIFAGSRKGLK